MMSLLSPLSIILSFFSRLLSNTWEHRCSSIHRVVFSSSSSFQTHLHSSCTFSPFIIHQQSRCKHHFCCLSYFPDSPTCYFPIRVNKSEKPLSLLHPASIHYVAFLPPFSRSFNPHSSASTHSPSPHFFPPPPAQLSFSSCFRSDPPTVPGRRSAPESPPLHLTVH